MAKEMKGIVLMVKMDKKWVVLCSTAVASVYAAAYFSTEAKAVANQPSQITIQSQSSQVSQSNMSPKVTSQLYKDGTYTGTGMNRRGQIQVAVTIKNDRITDVEISRFTMHYSERDVVGLPNEVIQNQSPQVMNVSGATYSTEAFVNAVQDALSQAQNA